MANHGVGTKYVSVNLNKSYGQQQSNHHYVQSNSSSGYGSNRARAGGGMVVLSRPRSSQKTGTKLSVPPPLNLPSLRKEHERIDLGSNAHSAGGISGSGVRPASSGLGWSKPAVAVALQEKERPGGDLAGGAVDGPSKMGNGVYMPPVARYGATETPGLGSERRFPSVEKAAILRGEDFPSLKATIPVMSGPGQKQKEGINQKQMQLAGEELSKEQGNTFSMNSSHIDTRPHSQSARSHVINGFRESANFHDAFPSSKHGNKQEDNIHGLLPLVHLNPRSDWADDERDTKHGLRDQDRDHRYQKDEAPWDRDFDMPWSSPLLHKTAAPSRFDRLGHRESESIKFSTGEVRPKSGGREANSWRTSSPLQREVGNDRNGFGARPSSRSRETSKDFGYISSPFRENARDNTGVRNVSYQHGARQPWNNRMDFSSNRGSEQQNRDKHPFVKGEKSYVEDPFGDSGFDVRDPFPVLGVVKKKKETLRQAEFHDPIRESFEAELERVQKMQEEERRRISEVQEKAIEQARKEEEERMRLAWEHEERLRRMEEETREAAFRAEQERLEAMRRAEELRKAKEEEKNRIFTEEERRKQAANQKLLELEEKIAKRQAEATKGNSSAFSEEKNLGIVKEREGLGEQYFDIGWGQGQGVSRGSPYGPYPEKLYQNTVGDDYYPFGRPKNFARQPRVLPPPSLSSIHKPSYRPEADPPGPSTYMENEMKYDHAGGETKSTPQGGYGGDYQDRFSQHQISRNEEQLPDRKPGPECGSQSSLSVSSPPDSPVHLFHDDIDESGASIALSGAARGSDCALLENNKSHTVSTRDDNVTAAASVISEDDEEWAISNNEQLQEQEEYDEDEDGYLEEDETHDAYEENLDLAPEFEDMHIQDKDSNMILGFNEGVEVEMPSDDSEKCHKKGEPVFAVPQHSVDSVQGQGFSNMTSASEPLIQPIEAPGRANVDDSSKNFLETENAMQNLAVQSSNSLQSPVVSEIMGKISPHSNSSDATSSGILAATPQLSSVKPVMSSLSASPSHLEEPVKLQFGLFSGPSLIQPPVPAIQIGSIQMPLPLHPQVGASITHMQRTQPPVFQLGQLRYAAPISQGVLPLSFHSFAQPSALSSISMNRDPVAQASVQLASGDSTSKIVTTAFPLSSGTQACSMRSVDLPNWNASKNVDAVMVRESTQANMLQQKQSESAFQHVGQGKAGVIERADGQPQTGAFAPLLFSIDKDTSGSKTESQAYRGRGKRELFGARNSSSRNLDISEVAHVDAGGFRRPRRQRTEFRIRSSNRAPSGDMPNATGRIPANYMGNGTRNIRVPNKSAKRSSESDSSRYGPASSQKIDSGCRSEIRAGKETIAEDRNISNGQANLKRNFSEEDIDVPLQSGIVRIFEQRGIEAPSDDDDFIEVISKRQMLNDRREQREKEIKAKSREAKVTRKPRSVVQNHVAVSGFNKSSALGVAVNNKQSGSVINKQHLAPIGTPTHKADVQADSKSQHIKSFPTSDLPAGSRCVQTLPSSFIFDHENKVSDNVQTPLGSWSGSQIDQPVMALTQSQLDEAMKPASIDTCASVEDPTGEPKVAPTSVLAKDETLLPVANPVDSLLPSGQIQFGAVTASTILPPSSRAASHGIGPPGPSPVNLQASRDHGRPLFYQKEQHLNDASARMEDCEAEAAASAIAVAAITSDETGGALVASSVSVAETNSFGGTEIQVASRTGIAGEQSNQSKVEESLSVSLPADLSVDTPPISLWPPLSSPHNSSNQMITHFPPGPHYPFYETNPMLRAPIFTFGPRDDTGSNQSQPQKSTGPMLTPPPGTWQQGPPGVDSFYGPPTGFTGPFMCPPGGMSGIQGSPHMVVYNHFAPVGQYSQVGLSFMGTTYIPSGKQPDWKHNPVSSPMIGGDCDAANSNAVSSQRNPAIIPASVQHLAPGSALLPMPSPLAMFDVSPFQSSSDMPVQGRWPHMAPAPFQPAPSSITLQQQTGGTHSSQFNHMPPVDQSSAPNRFPDVQTSTPSDTTRIVPAVTNTTVNRFPVELGLADTSAQRSIVANTSSNSATDAGIAQNTSSSFKPPPSQQEKNVSSSGFYNHQRSSQRNNDWHHHRRSGFQGRNQPMGGEKGFPTTKVKQIYVAKQTSSSTAHPSPPPPRHEQ